VQVEGSKGVYEREVGVQTQVEVRVTLSSTGKQCAEVANPRLDTCSREVFRHEVRMVDSWDC